MTLIMVGLSHKTAPLFVREKIKFSNEYSNLYLDRLSKTSNIRSGIVLSTCNRVEIYAHANSDHAATELKQFIHDCHQVHDFSLDSYLYEKSDVEVVRHLFSVASSLDSAVVGEPQILGQVKDAYDSSKKYGLIDPFFDKFLQKSFFVAKKIRTETAIGKLTVSISSMAVDLSDRVFESLEGKSALIIGAGEMADLAAVHLKQKGIKTIWIANRTFEHAATLAKTRDAFPIYFEQVNEVLPKADIILTATGHQGYILVPSMIQSSLEARKQQPQLYIDISVPRNIHPEVANIQNAYLYNIDDLQNMVDQNQALRREASQKAAEMIAIETEIFMKEVSQRVHASTIQKLQHRVSDLLIQEWKKSFPESDLAQAQTFVQSVSQKMIHSTVDFLKNDKDHLPEDRKKIIEKIFDLDSDPS